MQRYSIIHELSQPSLGQVHHLFTLSQFEGYCLDLAELYDIKAHADLMIAISDDQENTIIAFAWVKILESRQALIMDPIVHPDYRREGVGQTLLRHILIHPRLERCTTIELAKNVNEAHLFDTWRLPWMQAAEKPAKTQAKQGLCLTSLLLDGFSFSC